MKRLLIGAVLGIGVVVLGLGLWRSPRAGQAAAHDQVAAPLPYTPPDPARTGSSVWQQGVELSPGQLLLLRNRYGAAVVQITEQGASSASYRWRFQPPGGGPEQSGTGRVFERYEKVGETKDGAVEVRDVGGRTILQAGPFAIEWSSGGKERGWIYLDRDRMGARIVGGERFDAVSLR